MIRKLVCCLILCFFFPVVLCAQAPVRLKDIAKIVEARDNQLIGYGLVVGLRSTGDSAGSGVTSLALANLLGKLGANSGGGFNSRNAASVIVTATLPPFVKKGQRIPVIVSSLGDSSSLVGGTLLMTPLKGPDLRTYAVGQGTIVVGGLAESGPRSRYFQNQATVGRIPQGAIVEAEVPVTFSDQHHITIVMNESNFITVTRATEAIRQAGYPGARAIDANTVKIPLADLESSDLVSTIAQLENISLVPDASSKVVINSRTGTVVIGEMVRLYPVALTHGNISIRISDEETGGGFGAADEVTPESVQVVEREAQLIYLNPASTLSSLVNALNEIGASPKDLISILQALKASGSLVGDLQIL